MMFKTVLTVNHLRGIKDHQYKTDGISITEPFIQPFWRWLVLQVPLWVAPNLLTFTGLLINMFTCIAVIWFDSNGMGQAPGWLYLITGLGVFIYQSLDGIDGKQARRTGTATPLGELFDHGCDAISTFLVALAGASAVGLNEYPYLLLTFVLLIEFVNYVYHWQTYVSGCLYFKKVDCTEAQFCHIIVMTIAFFVGADFWKAIFPGLGLPFKLLIVSGVIFSSLMNTVSAFNIILTQGVGKNGATVADSSVLSPILPVAVLLSLIIYYILFSPARMIQYHSMLLLTALVGGPFIKFVLHMMIAGMCKTPLPFVDPVMLGPVIGVTNIMLGTPISEWYLLFGITIFNVYDLITFCITVIQQVCDYLEISCFTIPYPPPSITSKLNTELN